MKNNYRLFATGKTFWTAAALFMCLAQPLAAQDVCGIWFVTPNGNGNGAKNNPASLQTVIDYFTNNNVVSPNNRVRLSIGDYIINAPINVPNNIVLEGGYDPNNWQKLSNGLTNIKRTALNPEFNPSRLVVFQCLNVSGFRLRDLHIEVADGPSATFGLTTYGVYLNGCSDYEITRCAIKSGNGVDGKLGIDGLAGANGLSGGTGGKGCKRCDSAPGGYNNIGGDGGDGWSNAQNAGGKGGNGGTRGQGKLIDAFNLNQCPPVIAAVPAVDGGGGSAVFPIQPGQGGSAPVGYDFILKYDCGIDLGEVAEISAFLGSTINNCFSNNPQFFGNDGTDGMDAPETGDNNGVGAPPAFNAGFFVPGDGTDGVSGKHGGGGGGGGGGGAIANVPELNIAGFSVVEGNNGSPGGGGGGGGEGGEGGKPGTAGGGGGGSFPIFVWNGGPNGKIKDCTLTPGLPGQGMLGGAGGAGGNGGAGGAGGFDCNQQDSDCAAGCEGGRGGNGGKGGKGQSGGKGGDGADGIAQPFYQNFSGMPVEPLNVNCAGCEPKIKVIASGCLNAEVTYIMQNADADTEYQWTFGEGADPSTATGDTVKTVYKNGGTKNIILTIAQYPYRYSDFVDVFLPGPQPNVQLQGAETICANQTATLNAGSAAASYQWTVTPFTTHTDSLANTFTINAPANITQTLTYTVGLRIKTDCCGWSDVETKEIQVVPAITPEASVIPLSSTEICPGENVTLKASFINAGDAPAVTWFKNGVSLAVTDLIYETSTANDGDVFSVELNSNYPCLTNGNPTASNQITIKVFTPPQPDCGQTNPVRLGNPVTLNATLPPNAQGTAPYRYVWDLGNGQSTDTVYNASVNDLARTVTYGGPGTYTATLYVIDANGCKGSCQTTVVVQPLTAPVWVDFTAAPQPLSACESLTVTFTANGNATDYTWDFGDGQTGIGQTVTHTYTSSAQSFYTVTLIGKDLNAADTMMKVNFVKVYPKPNAGITISNEKLCANQPILFGNTGENAFFFEWNFGDQSPVSVEAAPYHSYNQAGTYTVTLKVWNKDADGAPICPVETTYQLEVGDRPNPRFSVLESKGCKPFTAHFTDLSTPYSGSTYPIVRAEWDFGDGTFATYTTQTTDVTHIYPIPGKYSVKLKVVNAAGCDSSFSIIDAIEVRDAEKAKIAANGQPIDQGDTLVIKDQDGANKMVTFRCLSPTVDEIEWDFSGVAPNYIGTFPQTVTYEKEGVYPVKLTVRLDGCEDTETMYVAFVRTDQLVIPNVFSPNGDGTNETFGIFAPNFTYQISIYSRWGDKVFEGSDANEWNGKHFNTGSPCPESVYVYYVRAVSTTKKGLTLDRSGSVTIVR